MCIFYRINITISIVIPSLSFFRPIGFEALSPQHEEMDTSTFSLDSEFNSIKQDTGDTAQKDSSNVLSVETTKEPALKADPELPLPGLGSRSPSGVTGVTVNSDKPSSNVATPVKELDETTLKDDSGSCQVKRSLSPEPSCSAKVLKTEPSDEPCAGILVDQKSSDIKTEEKVTEPKKEFSIDVLEKLVSLYWLFWVVIIC